MAACLRLAILFTSQAHVDGDEGVVGIMAKHVLGGARPVFYYGQPYGGGAAIEAYLGAISFGLLGVSVYSFKAVAFGLTLAALPVTWMLCLRHFDRPVAIAAVALLAVASAWIEWNTKVRGGYAALLLLGAAIWFLWAAIAYRGRRRGGWAFALGLVGGVAYYNQELLVPLLGLLAGVSGVWHRPLWSWPRAALLALGFVLGASPVVYHNLAHDFENLRHMFGSTRPGSFWQQAAALPTFTLPRFFDPQNADALRALLPPQAGVEYAVYALLLGYLVVSGLRRARRQDASAPQRGPRLENVMLAFVGVHLLAYLASRGAGVSARYLLPLYPPLAILAAVATLRLLAAPAPQARAAGGSGLALLLGIGLWNSTTYVGPSQVRIGVWTQEQGFENRHSSGPAIVEIVDLLHASQVRYVRSSHFVQWRLLFESNETIIASSAAHLPGGSVYPEYDRLVEAAEARDEPVAYVFHEDSLHWRKPGGYTQRAGRKELIVLPTWLESRGYRRSVVDDFIVYAPRPTRSAK